MAARAMVALLSAADLRDVQELFSPEKRKDPSFGLDLRQGERTQDAPDESSSSDNDECQSLQQEEAWSSPPALPGLWQMESFGVCGVGGSAKSSSNVVSGTLSTAEVCAELRDLQRLVSRLATESSAGVRSVTFETSLEPHSHGKSEVQRIIADLRRQLQGLELHSSSTLQARQAAAEYQSELATARAQADQNSAVLRAETREARGAAGQLLEFLEASERRNAKLEAEALSQMQAHGLKDEMRTKDRENTWLHAEFEQQCCRSDQLKVEVESLACELSAAHRRCQLPLGSSHVVKRRSEMMREPLAVTTISSELRALQDSHHSELMVLAAVMDGLTEGEAYEQLNEQMQRQQELSAYLHEHLESSTVQLAVAQSGLSQPAMLRELEEHQEVATELQQHASSISAELSGRLEEQQEQAEALERCAEILARDLAAERDSASKEKPNLERLALCEQTLEEEEAKVERAMADVQDAHQQLDMHTEQVSRLQDLVGSTQADLREQEQMVANLKLAYSEEQETASRLTQESTSLREQLQEQEDKLARLQAEVEERRSLDVPGLHVHPLPCRAASDSSGDSDSGGSSNPAEELAEALHSKIDASTEELTELSAFYASEKSELDKFREHAEEVVAYADVLQQELLQKRRGACAAEEMLEAQAQSAERLEAKCSALELDLATEHQKSEGVVEHMAHELAQEKRCEQALALDVETTAHEFMQLRSLQKAQIEECEQLAANAQAKWEGQESELQEEASALRLEIGEKATSTSAAPKEEVADSLCEELEEQRRQSQQLEVWLENLARELTAERQRSAARGPSQDAQLEAEVARLTSELQEARQQPKLLSNSCAMPLPTLLEESETPAECGGDTPPAVSEKELQLARELEESKDGSERLEVWVEALARELASEHRRAEEAREQATTREQQSIYKHDFLARELASEHHRAEEAQAQAITCEQQAVATYKQQEERCVHRLKLEVESESQSSHEALHSLLEEHHKFALEMQADSELQACQLTSELQGRMERQEQRSESLETEYVTLAEELMVVRLHYQEASQGKEVQRIEQELEKFCAYECSMGAEVQQLKASEADMQAESEARVERLSAHEGSLRAEMEQLRASHSSLKAGAEAQVHQERALQREVAAELEEAVMNSRRLAERNTQLEGRHRYDAQVVDELRKQLEQQWTRTAELEASHAALECQLAAKFQQSGDQQLLEARQEVEEKQQVVAELEQKLEFERLRAAQQEAALRAEADEAEAVAEELREQLGEQSRRSVASGPAMLAPQARETPLEYHGSQRMQHVDRLTRRLELSSATSSIRALQKFYLWAWWSVCCTVLCKKRMRDTQYADVSTCMTRQQASRGERVLVAHSLQRLGHAVGSNVCISKFLFLQIGFEAFRTQGLSQHRSAEDAEHLDGLGRRIHRVAANHLTLSRFWNLLSHNIAAAALAGLFSAWALAAGVRSDRGMNAGISVAEQHEPVALGPQSLRPLFVEAANKRCAHRLMRQCLVSWRHSSQVGSEWHEIGTESCYEAKQLFGELSALGARLAASDRLRTEQHETGGNLHQERRGSRHQTGAAALLMQQDHLRVCSNCFSRWRFSVWGVRSRKAAAAERAAAALARRADDDCISEFATASRVRSATAKPLARLLVRCERLAVCQIYIKSWSAGVKLLAKHAQLQAVISARRNEGKRQFKESQMVFKAARLGMEVTSVCERLAAAERRILHASAANHRCTEVCIDVLSKCFSRVMWHTVCRESLLAWHLAVQSSSIRFQSAHEMCAWWSEVERQNVESQRLCTLLKLIQAQVSEAVRTQPCGNNSVEVVSSARSTAPWLSFPPPALRLWARLCLFTWHHFMTSRTLVSNLVTSSEAVSADRFTCKIFAKWRIHTGLLLLKRYRKESRFRFISEMDAVLLRIAVSAWIALPWAARRGFVHKFLRKRPSRRAITADMQKMRCLISEWHREVMAERCMASLRWVDPTALTTQVEVDKSAPRVYQAVLLPAGSNITAVQFAQSVTEPACRREGRRMETE